MSKVCNLIMYAGPTLTTLSNYSLVKDKGFEVFPPIKREDLPILCQKYSPGIVVIVDGIFFNALAVGHREILDTISKGWEIWGISSIGAIRAYEMRYYGMKGFGSIFDYYCHTEDFQDDEVAMIHESTSPYRMLSEPLVHIRAAVEYLKENSLLTTSIGNEIIDNLKNRWFGERTLFLFEQELRKKVNLEKFNIICSFIYPFDRFRLKSIDLEQFLLKAPYLDLQA